MSYRPETGATIQMPRKYLAEVPDAERLWAWGWTEEPQLEDKQRP
jgi:hypothetical protein